LPYTKKEAADYQANERIKEFRFATKAGEQSVFYIKPVAAGVPNAIIVVYPGIETKALEYMEFADNYPDKGAGFLLFDYPGNGNSKGIFRPAIYWEASEGALNALALFLDLKPEELYPKLVAFGHSVGCGIALQYASMKNPFRKLVLVAPFTTLHDSLAFRIGPIAYLIPDGMDNEVYIKTILKNDGSAKLIIFHGKLDKSIPFSMGERLAGIDTGRIEFHAKEDSGHDDILLKYRKEIYAALMD
jgi:uncharacterized protein